jgi:hypothetical protein
VSENSSALYDGFSSLDSGVNYSANHGVQSGSNPNGLLRSQTAAAVNVTFRGGLGATHRPPFMRRQLLFESDDIVQQFGPNGLWQGFAVHEATESMLIVCVGGRQFRVRVESDFKVSEITVPSDANANNLNFSWFVQAGPFTVIQDGEADPLIWDGTKMRRARDNEIKVGTTMAFTQGRIVYAVYDQYRRATQFRATDLIGNRPGGPGQPGGTPEYDFQDSVLQENDNTFLNSGGNFTARSDMGEIRAMVVPRMLDTSLGQGPLQVMCERGCLSFNAPVDATQWKNTTYPILTESQLDYGAKGARFAVNVNGDIIFRSTEGFHSFKLARADFQKWLNTPISMEVDEIIEGDPEDLLFYGCGVLFDSRVIGTTFPRPTQGGIVHDGLVALDMNLVATLRQRADPAWEGLWTGLQVLQIQKGTFAGTERCFMFARSISGMIELWELLPSATTEIWDNGDTPIVWSFDTAALDFNSAQDLKRLQTAAVWTSDVQETVEYVMQWRPDQHPCYLDWHAWSDCAPIKQCVLPRCGTPKNLKPQYRPKVKLPQPPDICNGVNQSIYRDFFECQFRMQVTGHAEVRKVVFAADPLPEPFFEGCPLVGKCLPLDCCSPDPLEYSSSPYHNSGSASGGYYPNYPYVFPTSPPTDYPYPWFPPPPHAVPFPVCETCGVLNPPTPVQEPTPHNPSTFPGLPPVQLLPGAPPLDCPQVGFFRPLWLDPQGGGEYSAGMFTDDLTTLQDGTLNDWATQTWQKFSDFVIANGYAVTAAVILVQNTGDNLGPPGYRHWFVDNLMQQQVFVSSFGMPFELEVMYCLA